MLLFYSIIASLSITLPFILYLYYYYYKTIHKITINKEGLIIKKGKERAISWSEILKTGTLSILNFSGEDISKKNSIYIHFVSGRKEIIKSHRLLNEENLAAYNYWATKFHSDYWKNIIENSTE